MSKDSATVIKDGQLAVATVPQTGTLVGAASEIDATALVETADGLQLCVKTCEVGGGGGGGGTVDQTYDPTSTNAQSGTAVAEALAPALENQSSAVQSLDITPSKLANKSTGVNSTRVGYAIAPNSATSATIVGTNAGGNNYSICVGAFTFSANNATSIGSSARALGTHSIAIGSGNSQSTAASTGANAENAIQLGQGNNTTANTFQVYGFQLLNGTTGIIPPERLGTGYDATKTQVLKHVNGVLTWVDEA